MDALAWPGAVVAIAVIFMVMFKGSISRFLDRTKRVGKDGIQAYDEAPQPIEKRAALNVFLEGYQSPMLLEIENRIEEDIKNRGLSNPEDAHRALVKSLAGTGILLEFERLYGVIFTSQIAVLLYLNGRSEIGTPKDDLTDFYADATSRFPKLYEKSSFDEWLAFLLRQGLIREDPEGLNITVKGREFLKWRVDAGKSGPHYG